MHDFYRVLKFPAFFSHMSRTENEKILNFKVHSSCTKRGYITEREKLKLNLSFRLIESNIGYRKLNYFIL